MYVRLNSRKERKSNYITTTVKLQWLEHLWDHENLFEIEVVRVNVLAQGQEA